MKEVVIFAPEREQVLRQIECGANIRRKGNESFQKNSKTLARLKRSCTPARETCRPC
jgi:hypothetical protein